jgi:hypothetical protein
VSCIEKTNVRQGNNKTSEISQIDQISEELSKNQYEKIRLVKQKDGNKLYVEFYATGFLGYKKSLVAVQICKILEALKKMNLDKKQYEIVAIGKDLVDKYGNESEQSLISAVFSQQTVNKINFRNIRHRDILELADDISVYFNMDE